MEICGVFVLPATCIIPVSFDMKRSDFETSAATSEIFLFMKKATLKGRFTSTNLIISLSAELPVI
ncbi:MAG: hypothetical protein A2330_07905 [Ignavibacteria bacterium RIFOXYB2_FULL_36_7]|nr:MAG: hypothetical protein A2330_07905 [Ignavibacteria bacterium RIFOXYB2_FULL_36_7]